MVTVTPLILDIIADSVFLFLPDTNVRHIVEKIIVPMKDNKGNDMSFTFRYTIVLKITILIIKLIIDKKPFI